MNLLEDARDTIERYGSESERLVIYTVRQLAEIIEAASDAGAAEMADRGPHSAWHEGAAVYLRADAHTPCAMAVNEAAARRIVLALNSLPVTQ